MNKRDDVWISWEDHRRSRELSQALNVKFYPITLEAPRWRRYPVLAFKTISLLMRKRPRMVFVQNPSIVLAALVISSKFLFGWKVVVDRHSNFKFEHESSKKIKWIIFKFLSKYTLRYSDLTIVTNDYLKKYAEKFGARSIVLQDQIPTMNLYSETSSPDFMVQSEDVFNIMVVCTFNEDEPIREIVEAAKNVSNYYKLYLTGNYRKVYSEEERSSLEQYGIFFTGFIDESVYQNLMYWSDAVLVLTKKEYILNCGAYEALSFRKPMILSNTTTIREYFCFGSLYCDCTSEDIAGKLRLIDSKSGFLVSQYENGLEKLDKEWSVRFETLNFELKDLLS